MTSNSIEHAPINLAGRRKRISNKQRKLALGKINGLQNTDALREAGYTDIAVYNQSPIRAKGFNLAMAEEAQKAGYTITALQHMLKAKRMNPDEFDAKEIMQMMDTMSKVTERLAKMAGIYPKEDKPRLDNVIDITAIEQ